MPDECRRYFIIRCIIDEQVTDVVEHTERRILDTDVRTADDVRLQSKAIVQYSPKRRALNLELRDYLYDNLYYYLPKLISNSPLTPPAPYLMGRECLKDG